MLDMRKVQTETCAHSGPVCAGGIYDTLFASASKVLLAPELEIYVPGRSTKRPLPATKHSHANFSIPFVHLRTECNGMRW